MKFHQPEQVKKCNYRRKPDDPICGAPFTRPGKMKDHNWKARSRCDRHRKSGSMKEHPETNLGRYEVKNSVLDMFLYKIKGQPCDTL